MRTNILNFTEKKITLCLILLSIVCVSLFSACKRDENDPVKNSSSITPNNLLSAAKYDKLVVEIQCLTGSEPTTATLDNLKLFLEQRLNKPGGITIVKNIISILGKANYSLADIEMLEKNNRTQGVSGSTVSAYVLFVDGDYAGNSGGGKVLGIAYGATSMAMFGKTIKEFSGGLGKPSATALETTVIKHEFGHILGLVNNGTAMQAPHQDAAHGGHCNNKDCLMYYTAETSDIIANLLTGSVPDLDAACINDLKGNGGK